MRFTITWSHLAEAEYTCPDTPTGALTKALELLSQGFDFVVIFDDELGNAYASADFGQFYIDTGSCQQAVTKSPPATN